MENSKQIKIPAIERMCLEMKDLLNKYGFKDIQSITLFPVVPYDESSMKNNEHPTVTYNRNLKRALFL